MTVDNSMAGSHAGLSLTIDGLNALRPCESDDTRRVRAALRKLNSDPDHAFTAAEARAAGCTFDDIVWVASAVAMNDEAVERRLRHWTADCAAHVLHIFEERSPADDRPRRAIEAARLFADGEIDAVASAVRDGASDAASAAATDAGDFARAAARAAVWSVGDAPSATAWAVARDEGDAASAVANAAAWAARAAARAASTANAVASAVADGASAVAGAARTAVWTVARAAASSPVAAARAAAWDAASAVANAAAWDVAWDAEEQWQFDRLILWLSDPEPEPLPLPAKVLGEATLTGPQAA